MFNRIVFFWKIGCLGAILGLANWYVYKEALPAAISYAALIPFLVLPFCFSLAYNAIHSVPVSIAKLFSWTGGILVYLYHLCHHGFLCLCRTVSSGPFPGI